MGKLYILMMVRGSKPLAEAGHKKLSDFSMSSPASLSLIDHDKYLELVKDESLQSSDFWYPKKGEYALTILDHYTKYRETIDKMRTCAGDFMEGWYAAGGK